MLEGPRPLDLIHSPPGWHHVKAGAARAHPVCGQVGWACCLAMPRSPAWECPRLRRGPRGRVVEPQNCFLRALGHQNTKGEPFFFLSRGRPGPVRPLASPQPPWLEPCTVQPSLRGLASHASWLPLFPGPLPHSYRTLSSLPWPLIGPLTPRHTKLQLPCSSHDFSNSHLPLGFAPAVLVGEMHFTCIPSCWLTLQVSAQRLFLPGSLP